MPAPMGTQIPVRYPGDEEENATQIPMMNQMTPPAGMSPQMSPPPAAAGAPPQQGRGRGIGDWLQALAPVLAGGVGVAMGGSVGEALGGLAAGFADRRSQLGAEQRKQTFEQNEQMMQTAHKAVMSLQGKDLSKYPKLMQLTQKYREAMATPESNGTFLSPKEAMEIVALWTATDTQAEMKAEGTASQREGIMAESQMRGDAQREQDVQNEMRMDAPPETGPPIPDDLMRSRAQGRIASRMGEEAEMRRGVPLGQLGIPDLPAAAADMTLPRDQATRILVESLQQQGANARVAAQDKLRFAHDTWMAQQQYVNADRLARRQIFANLLERALTPSPMGDYMFVDANGNPDPAAAEAWVRQSLERNSSFITPPPGAGKGKVENITLVGG